MKITAVFRVAWRIEGAQPLDTLTVEHHLLITLLVVRYVQDIRGHRPLHHAELSMVHEGCGPRKLRLRCR